MKSTSLKKLLQGVAVETASYSDVDVSSMTLDSREVEPGCLFVALSGLQTHGLAFAASAQKAGAVAILWDFDADIDVPKLEIPLIAIRNLPASLGGISARFYDYSQQQLQVVGITGTDGKTSVSHFLAQAMNISDGSCSVIGTLGIGNPGTGNPNALEKATHTTPDVISVHKSLQCLSTQGSDCVAMEVSSHALDQKRVAGVDFDVAVLTNLTRDHLDYHGTVEAYAEAKARLFLEYGVKVAVLNLNDEFGVKLARELTQSKSLSTKVCGYAINDSEADYPKEALVASNAHFDHQGLQADITYLGQQYSLNAAVLGDFNLSNLLATTGALIALGHTPKAAIEMVSKVKTVPGRIEKVEHEQDFLAVVDYAHTPGAIESVLKALRAHCVGRLICVFGCGGDRDAGKRPLMAAAAEKLADQVIITDDNPRTEDPKQIMQDILRGLEKPDLVTIEHDRAAAIRVAVDSANAGDVVLVAGKGHEQFQLINGESLPFDDREQILQAIKENTEGAAA